VKTTLNRRRRRRRKIEMSDFEKKKNGPKHPSLERIKDERIERCGE